MKYWKWLLAALCLLVAYAGWCYAVFHGHVDPVLYELVLSTSLIIGKSIEVPFRRTQDF